MDELKSWFREGLIARTRAVETAARALSGGDPAAIPTIRRIAHSLSGAGAVYGFPEISAAAARLEASTDAEIEGLVRPFLAMLHELSMTGDLGVIKLLVLEDEPASIRMLERALSGPGREVLISTDAEQARRMIEEHDVALILLDLILPKLDGRALLEWIRSRAATRRVPVFVISAKEGPLVRTECFAIGADEYFVKPVNFDELSVAIGARLQRYAEQIRESRRDPLTGLANRPAFAEAFSRALAVVRREGSDLSLAMIDLDRFKPFNDVYGHAFGDVVLQKTAATLEQTLRGSDFVARWGGEEFVVMLPNTDSAGARIALEHVAKALRGCDLGSGVSEDAMVCFSAGAVDVGEFDTLEDTVARADRLLHMAKATGGGRCLAEKETITPPRRKVVVAEDDELLSAMIRRLLTEEDLDVICCADGREALSIARSTRPALLIIDADIPGMSGMDVLSALKSSGFHKRIPVMLLTGRQRDEDLVDAFDLGADDYVLKPFSTAELKARVGRHVGRPRVATVH